MQWDGKGGEVTGNTFVSPQDFRMNVSSLFGFFLVLCGLLFGEGSFYIFKIIFLKEKITTILLQVSQKKVKQKKNLVSYLGLHKHNYCKERW